MVIVCTMQWCKFEFYAVVKFTQVLTLAENSQEVVNCVWFTYPFVVGQHYNLTLVAKLGYPVPKVYCTCGQTWLPNPYCLLYIQL